MQKLHTLKTISRADSKDKYKLIFKIWSMGWYSIREVSTIYYHYNKTGELELITDNIIVPRNFRIDRTVHTFFRFFNDYFDTKILTRKVTRRSKYGKKQTFMLSKTQRHKISLSKLFIAFFRHSAEILKHEKSQWYWDTSEKVEMWDDHWKKVFEKIGKLYEMIVERLFEYKQTSSGDSIADFAGGDIDKEDLYEFDFEEKLLVYYSERKGILQFMIDISYLFYESYRLYKLMGEEIEKFDFYAEYPVNKKLRSVDDLFDYFDIFFDSISRYEMRDEGVEFAEGRSISIFSRDLRMRIMVLYDLMEYFKTGSLSLPFASLMRRIVIEYEPSKFEHINNIIDLVLYSRMSAERDYEKKEDEEAFNA